MGIKCKDLAKLLGVSSATISLVLNNKPGISPSLRNKLIEQIEELGYGDMLNQNSRQSEAEIKNKKKNIVYAIYSNRDEVNDNFAFFPAVLEGAEIQARDYGYNLQVVHFGHYNCRPRDCIDPNETLGIIVQIEFMDEYTYKELVETKVPFIVIDCYNYTRNLSSVSVNNEDGIFSAVKYLKEMGHSKIGYIASGKDTDSALERRRCYHQALREFKLEDRDDYRVFAGSIDEDATSRLMEVWQDKSKLPTAFLAENDLLAWRAMKALKKLGLRIPEDISIIGFDDRSVARLTDPALTTIKVPRHLIGRQSVIMLINLKYMIESGFHGVPYKMCVGVSLVERESVARLQLNDK